MTLDRALAIAAWEAPQGQSIPPTAELLADAQLTLTAELLKEIRELRKEFNECRCGDTLNISGEVTTFEGRV